MRVFRIAAVILFSTAVVSEGFGQDQAEIVSKAEKETMEAEAAAALAAEIERKAAENPYYSIVRRNAFGLREKAVAKKEVKKEEEILESDELDIIINGFSSRGKKRFAYFKIPDEENKGKFKYYTVDIDDDKANPIDVVKVEDKSIDIRYKGGRYTLLYQDVKNKVTRTAKSTNKNTTQNLPSRTQASNGSPTTRVNTDNSRINTSAMTRGNGSLTRNSRGVSGASASNYSFRTANGDTGTVSLRLPKREVRTGNNSDGISSDQQVIIMEANRILNEQQGIPMPPTPGLPETTIQAIDAIGP